MYKGNIKWYHELKGFGFITNKSDKTEVYVHLSDILVENFKTFKNGDPVIFDIQCKEAGPQAVNVRKC